MVRIDEVTSSDTSERRNHHTGHIVTGDEAHRLKSPGVQGLKWSRSWKTYVSRSLFAGNTETPERRPQMLGAAP